MSATLSDKVLFEFKQTLQKYLPDSIVTILKDYNYKILNVYRTYKYNLSFVEKKQPIAVFKNLIETTKKLTSARRKTILFYPNYPYWKASIYQFCLALGYDIINNPDRDFDVAIHWKRYATFFPKDPVLSRLSGENQTVYNNLCEDVSKTYIDRVFLEVFGYCTVVDPLTHTGKCVSKSDLNAQHDGKIINCPISSKQPGVIYQKLIDNEIEKGKVVDFRVPIFKQTIPVVYRYLKKNLNDEQRFFGYPSLILVEVLDAKDVFSAEEISKIIEFCQKIGLDYGEIDILKDEGDKRIYIIDANNTPSSRLLFERVEMPTEKCILTYEQRQNIIERSLTALQKEIFNLD